VAGGIDSIGSALEAGALQAGDPLVDMTGFSSVSILAVDRGTRVPGFIHSRHVIPGVDLLITATVTAGATIDWVNRLDPNQDLRDDELLGAKTRPGLLTFVPSLAGERTPTWNPEARGVLDGIGLSTDPSDIMIAAMEGNALALGRDLEAMRAAGFDADRVLSTGGGSTSRTWMQIKADVLGRQVCKPVRGHGAAEGGAALAGWATGVYSSVADLRALTSGVEEVYEPDPARHAEYLRKQERYDLVAALNRAR
jgi:xylulokinase